MSGAAVVAEEVGKLYQIGRHRGRSDGLRHVLSDALTSLLSHLVRRPPTEGSTSRLPSSGSVDFWALRGVSFTIAQGEVVGIIGRNGAGKSTLLKIISRITEPTEGRVRIRGRVASLLEVGTGFHQDLTGRENIFLNGAILGMSRQEIQGKFDEIVAFSEIDRFLDTPVKRYSSGMYVRLAFAVAAHLEPEILLVDEVLAVGDLAFQKKCLLKMQSVSNQGRTVLFVSHNTAAISRLCPRSMILESGHVAFDGDTQEALARYQAEGVSKRHASFASRPDLAMCLREIEIRSSTGIDPVAVDIADSIVVRLDYDVNREVDGVVVFVRVHDITGETVLSTGDADLEPERLRTRPPGRYAADFTIPAGLLNEGSYTVTVSMGAPFLENHSVEWHVVGFEVKDGTSIRSTLFHQRRPGVIGRDIPWRYSGDPATGRVSGPG